MSGLDILYSCRNEHVGLSVLYLLTAKMWPKEVFFVDIILVGVHLNWLNWFYLLYLVGDPLSILRFNGFSVTILDVTDMFKKQRPNLDLS